MCWSTALARSLAAPIVPGPQALRVDLFERGQFLATK
jgi:hypothetical protein